MRPAWVEVDLGAVADNLEAIAAEVAPAELCAVVKADAYGHGDVPVAETVLGAGASCLAVALVEEGARLREAGIDGPILLLSEPPPDAVREVVRWGLTPTVYREPFLAALEAAGTKMGVHLEIDTGMHRVGADPERARKLAERISASDRLELEGVWTHFPVAEEDPDFTRGQLDLLETFLEELGGAGIRPGMVHAANTAGALLYPEARYDMVRVGLGIYGMRPAPHVGADLAFRPAMRVVSRVSMTRRPGREVRPSYGRRRAVEAGSTLATFPVGYADGLPRALSERGEVLIGGRRRRFAGSITMDQSVVDAGADPVEVGEEVVLIGRQGEDEITADEWAELLGTINYEVVCRIGPRLPRRYRERKP